MHKAHGLCGDCLDALEDLDEGSVDAIICDPPYGTTSCSWDTVIPFDRLWPLLWRVLRPNGPVVLFGQEPFSSVMRLSAIDQFKYDWYWRKSRPSGHVNARLKPLKDIEVISVFSMGATANGSSRNMPYYPQGVGPGEDWSRPEVYKGMKGVAPGRDSHKLSRTTHGSNYPRQVLDYKNHNSGLLHPTQKPLDLMEYLVATYTQEGETVLDFAMGSGTTGVAAVNLNRRFIGIERDPDHFETARLRLGEAALI